MAASRHEMRLSPRYLPHARDVAVHQAAPNASVPMPSYRRGSRTRCGAVSWVGSSLSRTAYGGRPRA